VINSANGSHLSGKSNDDVTCFVSNKGSYVVEYFPRNLENIFKNLKMIAIERVRLKEIKQSDLRPFSKLVNLWLDYNDIEFLEDGLFAYNPELKSVNFHNNKIIHIGTQVFENLNELTSLYLSNNKCIDMYADNNQTVVKEIISQAKVKCFGYTGIEQELQKLENSLIYVTSESLPIFDQNLQNLQNRFRNSNFSHYLPLKQRFEAIASWISKKRSEVNYSSKYIIYGISLLFCIINIVFIIVVYNACI
jgi:Leucine-rich repeat (LRR) protein